MVDDELLEESIRTESRPFPIRDSQFTIEAQPLLTAVTARSPTPSPRAPSDFQKHRARGLDQRHRLLPARRRLRAAEEGAVKMSRADIVNEVKNSGLARPRRRRFSLRREVELHQARREEAGLSDLQRRRIRAGHVQGSLHHSPGSASADRGDAHLAVSRSMRSRPTSTSAANFRKARRSWNAPSTRRARTIFSARISSALGFDCRDLRPSRRRRLHLRRGDRA